MIRVQGVFRGGNMNILQLGVDDNAFGGRWTGPRGETIPQMRSPNVSIQTAVIRYSLHCTPCCLELAFAIISAILLNISRFILWVSCCMTR
jgi:hypothetical protein